MQIQPYIELPAWVRRNLFYTGVVRLKKTIWFLIFDLSNITYYSQKKMKNKKMKKVVMSSILALLDLAFELDIDPTVWRELSFDLLSMIFRL